MKRQRKKKTLAFKNAVAGYLFIAPFILGFILFMVVPLGQSLLMTFNDVNPMSDGTGFSMEWVGIKNYKDAFMVDVDFVPALVSELVTMVVNTPATLIFSFFIALLLNQNFKGRGAVRAIFFLPVILSSGVIVGLEYNNSLLSDMKDVISETSNDASVTAVLEDILITSGGGPMAGCSSMYSISSIKCMILRLLPVSRSLCSCRLCRRFHQVCLKLQRSRAVPHGRVSGRLLSLWLVP